MRDSTTEEKKIPSPPDESCGVTKSILESFQKDKLCDTILSAGGREFRVHKLILSLRCEYFEAFFNNTNGEPISGDANNNYSIKKYEISQDAEALEKILHYIYGSKEHSEFTSYDQAKKTILAAHEYLLRGYQRVISKYLVTQKSSTNFADLVNLAALVGEDKLGGSLTEVFFELCVNSIDAHSKQYCGLLNERHFIWNSSVLEKISMEAFQICMIWASDHPNEFIKLYHQYMQLHKIDTTDPDYISNFTLRINNGSIG